MPFSSILSHWRKQRTYANIQYRVEYHRRLAGLALLLLGGLTGCTRGMNSNVEVNKESAAYKFMHPTDIKPFTTAVPNFSSSMDVATGRPNVAPVRPSTPNLPMPVAGSSEFAPDDPTNSHDPGETAGSWVGTLDIYWKLNWMRQELLAGNVPRTLPDIVARQRRHIARILRESKHMAPDAGHYIPDGVTIEQALTFAEDALKQIETGLEHLRQKNTLEEAGIRTLSIPWTASEADLTRLLEQQGLIKAEHAVVAANKDDEESSSTIIKRPRTSQAPVTSQEIAVALTLKYARTYHTSPEDMARREFELALRDIVRLRDLLHYEYHKPSVPGSSTLIPGALHQEAGSLPPSSAKTSAQGYTDPFRKSGDTSSTFVDPFHVSSDPHPLR